MTRDEAIKILKKLIEGCYYPKRTEALNTAIQVLEQEPCEYLCEIPSYEMTLEQARQKVRDLRKKLCELLYQEPCDDCISRQAAVDEINTLHDKPNAWLDSAVDAVMALPSVTPQQKTGQWKKSRDCYGNNHFTCPFCGAKMQESEE